jgi:hypothetical protein
MDMDVQHGHGLTARTDMCSMEMDIQKDIDMHRGHGLAAWTRACSMDIEM